MSAMPSSPAKFAGGSDAWLGDGNATRDTMMLVFEIPHLSTEPFVPPSGETILRIEPDVYRKLWFLSNEPPEQIPTGLRR